MIDYLPTAEVQSICAGAHMCATETTQNGNNFEKISAHLATLLVAEIKCQPHTGIRTEVLPFLHYHASQKQTGGGFRDSRNGHIDGCGLLERQDNPIPTIRLGPVIPGILDHRREPCLRFSLGGGHLAPDQGAGPFLVHGNRPPAGAFIYAEIIFRAVRHAKSFQGPGVCVYHYVAVKDPLLAGVVCR